MRVRCPQCHTVNVVDKQDPAAAIGCGRCNQQITVPKSPLSPGVVYGDYAIREVLVKRSHDVDFIADQISLERPVVLKVLNPELCTIDDFTQAFILTARKTSRLRSPSLCAIFTIGVEDGIYFLARDMADELTLKHKLTAGGVLPWKEAVPLVCDVAEALDFAWYEGEMMHMNLKPDYIMVSHRGRAQLADVGLAALDPNPNSERIIGTPQYIAPERIVGLEGDNRSDLYSLGVTFYFMITGEFPFNGKNTNEIIARHLQEFPKPANQLVANIPASICSVLDMLLEKNPNMRYPSGRVLIDDLHDILNDRNPRHAVKAGNVTPPAETSSVKARSANSSMPKPGTLKVRLEGGAEAKVLELGTPKQAARKSAPPAATPAINQLEDRPVTVRPPSQWSKDQAAEVAKTSSEAPALKITLAPESKEVQPTAAKSAVTPPPAPAPKPVSPPKPPQPPKPAMATKPEPLSEEISEILGDFDVALGDSAVVEGNTDTGVLNLDLDEILAEPEPVHVAPPHPAPKAPQPPPPPKAPEPKVPAASRSGAMVMPALGTTPPPARNQEPVAVEQEDDWAEPEMVDDDGEPPPQKVARPALRPPTNPQLRPPTQTGLNPDASKKKKFKTRLGMKTKFNLSRKDDK